MKLIDILSLYNFRSTNSDEIGMYKNDTAIIRIYFDNEAYPPLFFFEFGVDSWNDKNYIRDILNEDIVNREVQSIEVIPCSAILQITIC